jgi:Fe-S-cluster-containing dehydrogenase component
MDTYALVIDVAKCWDCNNCTISCKDEHDGNDWPGYTLAQPRHGHRWMDVERVERGQYPMVDVAYRPTPCQQCRDAPCVAASGGAISRRADGIVLIDPVRAKGREDLVAACPYGAIFWNAERAVPQKCTLCAHLLDDGWKQPRCAQACFTGALKLEKLDEAARARLIEAEGLEPLHPERGTRPGVLYRNLHRFSKAFIGGSAVLRDGEREDCAKGAQVRLLRGQEVIAETRADAFGDFKFDRLEPGSGTYTLEATLGGLRSGRVEVQLGSSRNLGVLLLLPSSETGS